MKTNNHSGYILVLSLILTSAIVAVVTLLFIRGSIFVPFSSTIIKREQARLLALSGVQLAMSQLCELPEEEKEPLDQPKGQEQKPKKNPDEKQARYLLENLLPSLNRWQLFSLDFERDGVDGEIRLAIMSEDGKINVNQIFDFEKRKFRGEGTPNQDVKKILQELFKKIGLGDLIEALGGFLAKRGAPLEDVTQLLSVKGFEKFKDRQFYEPPPLTRKKVQETRPLYLSDIFTVVSAKSTLQPWLFSDSLLGLLGFKRAQINDVEKREKMVDGWLKKFKLRSNWKEDWNTILKPLYEKDLEQLPKDLVLFLDNLFDPTFFSVISYGTVADTRQRLFAILERKKQLRDGKTIFTATIKRIYWL